MVYIVVAIVAWQLLPGKIADAERRLWGVRAAIVQLMHDQQFVSDRVRTITNETLGQGKGKIAEVAAMLGDPDLNHIALTYMGSDWSLQRSSFLGQVAHARKLLETQKIARENTKSRLNEKIKELEVRKRTLIRRLRTPSDDRAWHVEMDDIERQLVTFRSANTYKEYLDKDANASKHIEATAKNEDALFKMALESQEATVGRLNQVLAERLGALRWTENEPIRLRRVGLYFNIWPLNWMFEMPMPEDADEKRL